MYIRSSGPVYPNIILIRTGDTCRYLIVDTSGHVLLTDPGLSAHTPLLLKRLAENGISPEQVTGILLTHGEADHIGAIPSLRKALTKAELIAPSGLHEELQSSDNLRRIYENDCELSARFPDKSAPLDFDQFVKGLRPDRAVVDSDFIKLGENLGIRAMATPGHTLHSMSYLVTPYDFLIVDETFGFFNGRKLPAPGSSFDLEINQQSIIKISKLELSGIGFPYGGAITGNLVRKHLVNVLQVIQDTQAECLSAWKDGIGDETILQALKEQLYACESRDPALLNALDRSLNSLYTKLLASKEK